jgi:hypothetical protein
MHSNPERFITPICSAAHAVAEKPLAHASWRVHSIVKKVQRLIHAVSVNPVPDLVANGPGSIDVMELDAATHGLS